MDHRWKLQWAARHIEKLTDAFGIFLQSDPYTIGTEFDATNARYVARIVEVAELPRDLSLILGDAVHGMRSALDTLTFALAAANLKRMPTQGEAIQIQFVIVDNASEWPKKRDRQLSFVDGAAQTAIESLQPYYGSDPGPRAHLAVLRDLSNVDKHRHIPILLSTAEFVNVSVVGPGASQAIPVGGYRGPLERGTALAQWVQWAHLAGTSPKMDVHATIIPDIELSPNVHGPDISVLGFLPAAHNFIRDVVFPKLEPFL